MCIAKEQVSLNLLRMTNVNTGEYIFYWMENCIKEVGGRVRQVVTNNHQSNMTSKNMLKESRPNIFWNNCAVLTLDFILVGIKKLLKHTSMIEKARARTVFMHIIVQSLCTS